MIALIAAAGLMGAALQHVFGSTAAAIPPPSFATQPNTWNVRYTPIGGSRVAVTAERVPGYGPEGQYEEWESDLVWESPDKTYGVLYGGAPDEQELKGFIYARRR